MPPRPPTASLPIRCSHCTSTRRPSSQPLRTLTTTTPLTTTPSTTTPKTRTVSPSPMNQTNTTPSTNANATSTSKTATTPIPPASPRYIDVPPSLQPDAIRKPWLKGILPTPRDLFTPQLGGTTGRTDPARLSRIGSNRKKEPLGPAPATQTKYNEYKARMAASRRQNYKEGIVALARRRERRTAWLAARSAGRLAERRELLEAKERDDERLTKTSVTDIMLAPLKRTGVMPDPNRAERLAEKASRVAATQEAKAQKTQAALHELYLQARNFIVTEDQLDKAIDSEFGTQTNPREWPQNQISVWGEGLPPTLQSMVEQASRASGPGGKNLNTDDIDARERLMRERLGRVAGELTGGKLD